MVDLKGSKKIKVFTCNWKIYIIKYFAMAQNINPFIAQQSNSVKQNEETTNRSKDNHAVSKR